MPAPTRPAPTDTPADTSIAGTLPQIARLPHALGLTLAVLLLGLATSLAGPFMSLFAVQQVGMSPLQLGIFLTLNALSAVVISTRLGRWADRRSDRKPLVLLTLAAGVLAYLALSGVRSVYGVMATGVLLLAVSSAAFPQVFAFARSGFAGAPGDLPEKAVTVLRAVFSFAWVVGPGVGAAVLSRWSFSGVFLLAAACYALAALPLLFVRPAAPALPTSAAPQDDAAPSPLAQQWTAPPMGWIVAAFVLYGMAMHMGMVMFSLFVTETLRGTEGQVGFLVGLCALLEIPVMLLFVLSRRLPSVEWLIKASLLLFVLHFGLIYLAQGMPLLIVTQAIRAAVLAVMAGLGMTYFQQLMPGRFSAATTLYSNTSVIGSMLSGIVAGAWAQLFGYRPVFVLCAALSLAAWGMMLWATRRRRPAPAA
ncbi:sugar efflux transporter [Deinococcus wulumuqiensis]|uniref:Sugar efflux transporter n=2 Tax=Deinococcus wulumuqiensis TaxID=980427 RepID=A0AAV4K7M5_9DEIO|nr:sugar efflux transporter [Deinococcus wulumuqiensis]GGI76150.1 putative sugar efflux transporter [Deinococcus wulumuqiensis]GGP28816.1 putative sugar efflux transporter [Deinococcus wulumuqiensis]